MLIVVLWVVFHPIGDPIVDELLPTLTGKRSPPNGHWRGGLENGTVCVDLPEWKSRVALNWIKLRIWNAASTSGLLLGVFFWLFFYSGLCHYWGLLARFPPKNPAHKLFSTNYCFHPKSMTSSGLTNDVYWIIETDLGDNFPWSILTVSYVNFVFPPAMAPPIHRHRIQFAWLV